MATEYPGNADIEGSLAYVEDVSGDKEVALAQYRSAIASNPNESSIYWNYARLLDDMGGELEPRLQALENALRHQADLVEARLRLARDLGAAARWPEALAVLQQIKRVEPAQTAVLYIEMTVAALGSRHSAEARQYVKEAEKAARTPEEKAHVERLLARIQQDQSGEVAPGLMGPPSESDSERPILQRKTPIKKQP